MRHRKFILASLSCLLVALIVLGSCKRESECRGIIFTYTEKDGVKIPVGGCTLVIGDIKDAKGEVDTSNVRKVITDANGYYEGTWYRQLRLPIDANKGDLYGIGVINLEPGNVTHVEVPMIEM